MGVSIEQLRGYLDSNGFTYLLDPNAPNILMSFIGENANYEVALSIQEEGNFLQLRSIQYMNCQASNRHAAALFRDLCLANATLRMIKFGWETASGEVIAFTDYWLMDADLSEAMFRRLFSGFLSSLDQMYPRFKGVLESGVSVDPTSGPRVPEL